MAYTAPTTQITGHVVTSTEWNTDLVDNIKWLATDKPMVRATSSTQSLSGSTWTAVACDGETFDNSTAHDNSTNNTRITIPVTGKYLLGGNATVTQSGGSTYDGMLGFRYDGTTYFGYGQTSNKADVDGYGPRPTTTTLFAFTAAQYVELMAWENYGSTGLGGTGRFWAAWIGT